MRPTRDLAVLAEATTRRLAIHRDRAVAASAANTAPARRELAYVSIEVLNVWANFCRSYFLSAILKPRRKRGGVVTAVKFTGTTFTDALRLIMKRHRPNVPIPSTGAVPRREEPPWFDTTIFWTSCDEVGCSNIGQIQLALSFGSRAFLDLPVFRNFFAHRNDSSAAKARATGLRYNIATTRRHPADILSSRPYGRPVPLIVDWIDDITVTVDLLCE